MNARDQMYLNMLEKGYNMTRSDHKPDQTAAKQGIKANCFFFSLGSVILT